MHELNDKIKRILNTEYHDPFEVLGAHSGMDGCGVVVRAYLPDMPGSVYLVELDENAKAIRDISMKELENIGFYEVSIDADINKFRYKLKVAYGSSDERVIYDPYSFSPVISDFDLYLFGEGRHLESYNRLGAHPIKHGGVDGLFFAVWAPNACRVSVVGDFNGWDGRLHPMRIRGSVGIWELFMPGLGAGEKYKFEVKSSDKHVYIKSDPYSFYFEQRPDTAGIVCNIDDFKWDDDEWVASRVRNQNVDAPISIYEVHLGSWARVPEENNRFLSYRELAVRLLKYVQEMGYTHLQLMPVEEHPLDASWGYQVTGYFAPTSRFGTPDDFAYFVNYFHKHNIGVLLDWVPAHFPKDAHALAYFDGTFLYEHSDPRKGEHQDWGTLIFNYGRNEVKNFLISNGLFWVEKYHIDGLRVDAVASMLYLDYSRNEGEWIPNIHGGRENLEAVAFIKEFNEVIYDRYPGVMMIAEESTSWPAVSRPIYLGGLGFGYKWNMGWMNDTLKYFSLDPVHRKYHQEMLTFSMIYAYHENFILVISHDEVVHGKRSVLDKMPGDVWQKFANLRLLFCYMYAHPGKKMLFMGGEFGQWEEWNFDESLKWHLLEFESHMKLQKLVKDLNCLYRDEAFMHQVDYDHTGFEWIDFEDTSNCVFSFIRRARDADDFIICIFNMTPVVREKYRVGVPVDLSYDEILNSDSQKYWGSNKVNEQPIHSEPTPWQSCPFSIILTIPPLGAIFLKPRR